MREVVFDQEFAGQLFELDQHAPGLLMNLSPVMKLWFLVMLINFILVFCLI